MKREYNKTDTRVPSGGCVLQTTLQRCGYTLQILYINYKSLRVQSSVTVTDSVDRNSWFQLILDTGKIYYILFETVRFSGKQQTLQEVTAPSQEIYTYTTPPFRGVGRLTSFRFTLARLIVFPVSSLYAKLSCWLMTWEWYTLIFARKWLEQSIIFPHPLVQ